MNKRLACKLLVLDGVSDDEAGPAALKSAEKVIAIAAGSQACSRASGYVRVEALLGAEIEPKTWPVVLPMRQPVRPNERRVTAGVWLVGSPEYQAKAGPIARTLIDQGVEMAVMGSSVEGLHEHVQVVNFDPFADNYHRFAKVCDVVFMPLMDQRQFATDGAVARLLAYETPVVLVGAEATKQTTDYAPCLYMDESALARELSSVLSPSRLEAWRSDIRTYMAARFGASVYLERIFDLLSKCDTN